MTYRSWTPRDSRTAGRVFLILAVSIGQFAGAALAQQESAPVAASEGRISNQEAEALIADIKEVAAEADLVLESFASPRIDREIILEDKEYDPEQIFEWVKSETRWVPYRGILRGAAGVLMDRRGNSLDRSLLLAALLEDAGIETRLAHSSLSRELAATLLEADAEALLDDDKQPSIVPSIEAMGERQQEVEAQSRDLAKLSGLSASAKSEPQTDVFLDDISDHWWVQVKRDSAWQDLDLMAPAGASLLTGEPLSTFAADDLPEELYHRLDVRVVIERWEEGKLIEEVPLRHGFAVGKVPLFTHVEIDFSPFAEEWVELDEADGGLDALEIADSARFWRPTLKVNGTTVTGEWFTAAGRFELPTTLVAARKLEEATEGISALGGKRPDKVPDTYLTAVWLEFETSDPGKRGERVRRELFDLLRTDREPGRAPESLSLSAADNMERGLALLGQTSSLVLSSTPHPAAVEKVVFETLSENRNAFIALVYLAAGWEDDRVPIALNQAVFRPIDLLAMASLRDLWSRHRDLTYLDRTNVLSTHLIQSARGDTTTMLFATDIVMHRIGVTPGALPDARFVRLEQGVLDTLVETTFSNGEETHNTFLHFAERSQGSDDWFTIAAESSADESMDGIPARDRSRMRSAIRHGNVVVASPTPRAIGNQQYASWWRIDPADGTTLGLGYRGWGGETAENPVMNIIGVNSTREVSKASGKKVACKTATGTMEVLTEVTLEMTVPAELLAYDAHFATLSPEKKALIRKIKKIGPLC